MKNHLRRKGQPQEVRHGSSLPDKDENAATQAGNDSSGSGTMNLDTHGQSLKKKSSIWTIASRFISGPPSKSGPPPPPRPQIPVPCVADYEARFTTQHQTTVADYTRKSTSESSHHCVKGSRGHGDVWVTVSDKGQECLSNQAIADTSNSILGDTHELATATGVHHQDAPEKQKLTAGMDEESEDHVPNHRISLDIMPSPPFYQPPASSPSLSRPSSQHNRIDSSISTSNLGDTHTASKFLEETQNCSTESLPALHDVSRTLRTSGPSQLQDRTSELVHNQEEQHDETPSSPLPPCLCDEKASPSTLSNPSTPRTPFTYTPLEQQFPLYPPLRIRERPVSSPDHELGTNCFDDANQEKSKNKRSSARSGLSSWKRKSKASFMSLFSN